MVPMDHLERVRRVCRGLPDVTEKIAWGAPTFRVRGKMFAMFADDHHGDGRIALWCHSDRASQQVLVDSDPKRFFVPPYVGCGGWVGICLDRSNDGLLADCIAKAHASAAPKARTRKKPAPRS
jgi:hypothetical protein